MYFIVKAAFRLRQGVLLYRNNAGKLEKIKLSKVLIKK